MQNFSRFVILTLLNGEEQIHVGRLTLDAKNGAKQDWEKPVGRNLFRRDFQRATKVASRSRSVGLKPNYMLINASRTVANLTLFVDLALIVLIPCALLGSWVAIVTGVYLNNGFLPAQE